MDQGTIALIIERSPGFNCWTVDEAKSRIGSIKLFPLDEKNIGLDRQLIFFLSRAEACSESKSIFYNVVYGDISPEAYAQSPVSYLIGHGGWQRMDQDKFTRLEGILEVTEDGELKLLTKYKSQGNYLAWERKRSMAKLTLTTVGFKLTPSCDVAGEEWPWGHHICRIS